MERNDLAPFLSFDFYEASVTAIHLIDKLNKRHLAESPTADPQRRYATEPQLEEIKGALDGLLSSIKAGANLPDTIDREQFSKKLERVKDAPNHVLNQLYLAIQDVFWSDPSSPQADVLCDLGLLEPKDRQQANLLEAHEGRRAKWGFTFQPKRDWPAT
jgi:hypothetical protein